jgi:hypothetical protein
MNHISFAHEPKTNSKRMSVAFAQDMTTMEKRQSVAILQMIMR